MIFRFIINIISCYLMEEQASQLRLAKVTSCTETSTCAKLFSKLLWTVEPQFFSATSSCWKPRNMKHETNRNQCLLKCATNHEDTFQTYQLQLLRHSKNLGCLEVELCRNCTGTLLLCSQVGMIL